MYPQFKCSKWSISSSCFSSIVRLQLQLLRLRTLKQEEVSSNLSYRKNPRLFYECILTQNIHSLKVNRPNLFLNRAENYLFVKHIGCQWNTTGQYLVIHLEHIGRQWKPLVNILLFISNTFISNISVVNGNHWSISCYSSRTYRSSMETTGQYLVIHLEHIGRQWKPLVNILLFISNISVVNGNHWSIFCYSSQMSISWKMRKPSWEKILRTQY